MMKRIAFIWFLFLISFELYSQKDSVVIFQRNELESIYRDHSVSFVPQYIFISGIRIDFEQRITKSHWIQFSAEAYARDLRGGFITSEFDAMKGYGFGLNHKIYFNPRDPSQHGMYFSYGGSFRDIELTYSQDSYNYNTYFNYKDNITMINSIAGNLLIGHQSVSSLGVIFDFYAGVGIQTSMHRYHMANDQLIGRAYNSNPYDFGYSGSYFIAGFKLGFLF